MAAQMSALVMAEQAINQAGEAELGLIRTAVEQRLQELADADTYQISVSMHNRALFNGPGSIDFYKAYLIFHPVGGAPTLNQTTLAKNLDQLSLDEVKDFLKTTFADTISLATYKIKTAFNDEGIRKVTLFRRT